MCVRLCGLPGDIEERKTNAVFDEDGEIVHVQHRLAGRRKRKREQNGEKCHITHKSICAYVLSLCVCACQSYIVLSFSAGHHP